MCRFTVGKTLTLFYADSTGSVLQSIFKYSLSIPAEVEKIGWKFRRINIPLGKSMHITLTSTIKGQ